MWATQGSTSRATRAKTADNASGVIGVLLIASRLSSALARVVLLTITPITIPIDRQLIAASVRINWVARVLE